MPNALINATSPYLRQHADNPVDWVEWTPDAFAEARRRDVPVLVSIGYATCHWCHVMAHECFEDPETAALMNRLFVNIKVDREELPEVDEIYMDAQQALHGQGGWPLNAFVDHDGRPFFSATYFPRDRWRELVNYLSGVWQRERTQVERSAQELTGHLLKFSAARPASIPNDIWTRVAAEVERVFDEEHPGINHAPKFPPSQWLIYAMAVGDADEQTMATAILEAMQDSGLHDRVGGGFHRYATDRQWRVPHFEKMLYDNAQLAVAYALAAARAGRDARPDFARTAESIAVYIMRDLRVTDADGAFAGYASAEDADDPDGEGSFYAWSPAALAEVIGEAAAERLARDWDLAAGEPHIGLSGHLEPVTSHIPHPRANDLEALARERGLAGAPALRASWDVHHEALRVARDARPRPIRDDKVLTDLNGLALAAFSALARLLDSERARDAARELAARLRTRLGPDGLVRLPGRPAFITDYGHLALGLVEAYRALGDPELVAFAEALIAEAEERLGASEEEGGGFYTTPAGRGDLIRRSREHHDGPYPAGQHALALAAVQLYGLTGRARYRQLADRVFTVQSRMLERAPLACPTLLHALAIAEERPLAIVVCGRGPEAEALLARARALPGPVAVIPTDGHRDLDWPLLEARLDLPPQALVCEGTRCLLPARTVEELEARLVALASENE